MIAPLDYLRTMLDMLTSGYSRKDVQNAKNSLPMVTNIGRLFALYAWGLQMVHDHTYKVWLWDDIDYAEGIALDRLAINFGVRRNGESDEFFRLEIKVKMISQISGGDVNTLINAAAALFEIAPSDVTLEERYPAKVRISLDRWLIDDAKAEMIDAITTLMKRICAAGVGMEIGLISHRDYKNEIYVSTVCVIHAKVSVGLAN